MPRLRKRQRDKPGLNHQRVYVYGPADHAFVLSAQAL